MIASQVVTSAGTLVPWSVAVGSAVIAIIVTGVSIGRKRSVERLARSMERAQDLRSTSEWPASLASLGNAIRRTADEGLLRERALTTRVQELEAILRSTTDGVVALDAQQRVLDLNAAAEGLLGIPVDVARGRLLQETTRQPDLNRFLTAAMLREDASEGEIDLGGASRRAVRANAAPLRDATGRRLGLLLSLQDVTRLRRLESLRTDFVANVSHELRTPITSIRGYIETLLQIGADDPSQVRRFLEIVQRNTQRLSNLVEDLLALASLEGGELHGRSSVEASRISALEIVHEVHDQLAPAADARRVELIITVESDMFVWVNRLLAEQALVNLVSNAVRYAPEGSQVRLTARCRDDGFAEFAVVDRGPGIAPVHHERIFERFYRVDRARARAQGGTGLGLAIVKHIAQAHGGRVELESGIGAGSTFRLLLPLHRAAFEATHIHA